MVDRCFKSCHAFVGSAGSPVYLETNFAPRSLRLCTPRRYRLSALRRPALRPASVEACTSTSTSTTASASASASASTTESSPTASPARDTGEEKRASSSTFARAETFSRRRIGLYELKREGVDASVLLKRGLGFEAAFGGIVLAFTSVLFFIPLATHTPVREDVVGGLAAIAMGAWAVDTLALNAAFATAAVAAFEDRMRVARHEAAHLLVAHLLGFRVASVVLPGPRAVWLAARDAGPTPGVALDRSLAQGDAHRIAAVGLAGLAAELLVYHSSNGASDDMAQVSRRVRRALADERPSDEDVKHVVRWGLIVATRIVKQHCVAFEALVSALLEGKDAPHCISLIDHLADLDHLVDEPFGST